jgi:hypothetical protein
MSAAHKNECPVAAGQNVKSTSKHATDFIATCTRFATADKGYTVLFVVVLLQAALLALVEVLQ